MAQGLRLELRQSQRLAMTPQLRQAIRLLQMSNLELRDFVGEEVEKNPLLTVAETPDDRTPEPTTSDPILDDRVDRWGVHDGGEMLGTEAIDTGAENIYDVAPGEGAAWAAVGGGRGHGFDTVDFDLADEPDRPATLREHLIAQLGQMRLVRTTAALARLIVEELDEAGYLRTPLDEVGVRLDAPSADLEAALATVQALDPPGVGARNLGECLALQLAERGNLDPAMQALIDHLDLVARGERRRLRALCGVDDEDLTEMLAELRALDPRPGTSFASDPPATRVPDVLLRRAPDGGWEVELNPETLPRVLIDRRYAAQLGAGAAEAKTFLAECRSSAHWLTRSLDQRARTIVAVAAEIVRRQEGFLAQGISALRPLTLRIVAEATGLHESTVSRVTANKSIATPRGVLELRFFFTNAVGEDGPAAEAVRHRIRALIEAERPGAILSDDAIVERLQGDGIEIARRTVAKYRTVLGIPSSAERRRMKAALAPG